MRLLTTIVAVLMLSITVVPCADAVASSDIGIENHDHSENDDHRSDNCSPFCICQCCSSSVIFSMIHTSTSIGVSNTFYSIGYYSDFYPNTVVYAVWHPPQVS